MGAVVEPGRLEEVTLISQQLQAAAVLEFSTLSGPASLPEEPGVYVIWDKETGETLYVGKTTNLRQRLYKNHLMGPLTNARLKKYLIQDNWIPEITGKDAAKRYIKERCAFSYLLEGDYRKRGHLEGLVSFLCNCRYVDIEH